MNPADPWHYFRAYRGSPWHFVDHGSCLAWRHGKTIAFWPQIDGLVRHLAAHQCALPPFPALVLLLDALPRGQRALDADGLSLIATMLEQVELDAVVRREAQDALVRLPDAALRLRQVAAGLQDANQATALLAGQLFAGVGLRADPAQVRQVLEAIDRGSAAEMLLLEEDPPGAARSSELAHGIVLLERGLRAFDPSRVAAFQATGTTAELRAVPLELPPPERARRLIQDLRHDREHAALARLAHDLTAALRLSRPPHRDEDAAAGGAADLSNRGPLDRLLLSELAHDDLTLATRVALNEALYLRRESPPRPRSRSRHILIDTGIRLWGVPRLFATAVALGLVAMADAGAVVAVASATADGLEPADLTDRAGLIEQLGRLSPAAHPTAALRRLRRDCADDDEVVLVTHPAVLGDPEFLAELGVAALHVITVDARGALAIHAVSARGLRRVRTAQIDLADLVGGDAQADIVAQHSRADLPALLRAGIPPLRPPHEPAARWSTSSLGTVAFTRRRELFLWDDRQRGPRWIAPALALRGPTLAFEVNGTTGQIVTGPAVDHPSTWTQVDLATGATAANALETKGEAPIAALLRPGLLALVFERRVALYQTGCGQPLESLDLPKSVAWHGGRFFVRREVPQTGFLALAFAGMSIALEEIPIPAGTPVVALFDRPGHDGPWAIAARDQIVDLANGTAIPLQHGLMAPCRAVLAAADGNTLWTRSPTRRIDLVGRSCECIGEAVIGIPRQPPEVFREFTVRRNFQAVQAHGDGTLWIQSDARYPWTIRSSAGTAVLMLVRGESIQSGAAVPFAGSRRREPFLQTAVLPGGGRVQLDRHGILHLRPRDPAQLEIALLIDGHNRVAAWTSDGRLHHHPWLTGAGGPALSAQDALARIAAFARENAC